MKRFPMLLLVVAVACASANGSAAQNPASPASPSRAAAADTGTAGLIPAGYGSLRQDDIAIKIPLENVAVRLIPLDESVIRTLSPDSYRALHDVLASQQDQITRLARVHGLQQANVWYVSFFGLAPEARFTPTDVTITSSGREFRPLEIIPLTAGFGEHRLQPREVQQALYLFDDGIDLSQPLTVTMGMQQNTDWQTILRTIEQERAMIRSRAATGRE